MKIHLEFGWANFMTTTMLGTSRGCITYEDAKYLDVTVQIFYLGYFDCLLVDF